MKLVFIVPIVLALASCASDAKPRSAIPSVGPSQIAEGPSTLAGEWEFDARETATLILASKKWKRQTVDHVIKAYLEHSYVFRNGRYWLLMPSIKTTGRYKLEHSNGIESRIVMTCPRQESPESGTIQIDGDRMIYRSDSPLFAGEALIYRKCKLAEMARR